MILWVGVLSYCIRVRNQELVDQIIYVLDHTIVNIKYAAVTPVLVTRSDCV